MSGYWQNDKATGTTLKDGWLYTGDMGTFDPDGFLTLKDRSKGRHHFGRLEHLSA
jgi:long-subunit acyl-CoA synthetase (AMP-forming)